MIAIATSLSARNGILVKDRLSLERSRLVDVVLFFDKTGTLTRGEHVVTDVAGADHDAVLAQAAAVEVESEHPLARAIVGAARERAPIPAASGFSAMSGRGVEASVNGTRLAVGGPSLLRERGVEVPDDLREQTRAVASAWRCRPLPPPRRDGCGRTGARGPGAARRRARPSTGCTSSGSAWR